MDEHDERRRREGLVAPRVTMDGPPWGGYIDPDLAYIRGQLGSVGSGALGGRSSSSLGGFIEVNAHDTKEAEAEAHEIRRERAERAEEPQDDLVR